jgi:hypothetical protein
MRKNIKREIERENIFLNYMVFGKNLKRNHRFKIKDLKRSEILKGIS